MQIEHPEHAIVPPTVEIVAELDAKAAAHARAQTAAAEAEQTFQMAYKAIRVLVPHVMDSNDVVLTAKQPQIDAMKDQVWNCAVAAYKAQAAAEAA